MRYLPNIIISIKKQATALIKTKPAAKSLTTLTTSDFLGIKKSAKFSMEVFKTSAERSEAKAIIKTLHSEGDI